MPMPTSIVAIGPWNKVTRRNEWNGRLSVQTMALETSCESRILCSSSARITWLMGRTCRQIRYMSGSV